MEELGMDIIDFTGIFDYSGRFIRFSGYEDLTVPLVVLSEKSRREGLLSLDDDLESIENTLLRKFVQLVVDGTDPVTVRVIGEKMIGSTLHFLEEILACVEFTVINAGDGGFDDLPAHYIKSRDLGRHVELAKEVCAGLSSVIKGGGDYRAPEGRYSDLVEMLKEECGIEEKYEMTVNHINSVLYINRVYYEMILTGALSIQGGDNPRILLERLNSIAGIKVQEEENADILPIDNPESVELFTSYVAANEVIATCTGPSGGYIPVARVLDVAGDSYAGMEFKPGRNTVVSTDTLLVLADINGDVVLKNGIIHVVPLFTVKRGTT